MTPSGTSWPAAEAKFTANLSGTTSVAAGFMGSDAGYSTDLGGSRVLWVFGDTFWATAAGQTRAQCQFVRNTVALQTGSYDLSAATLTFYSGGTSSNPRPFFNWSADAGGCPRWVWPNQGIYLDGVVLLLLSAFTPDPTGPVGFQFKGAGSVAVLMGNLSGTPDTWTKTYVPVPSEIAGPSLGVSLLDGGDGYVYCWATRSLQWNLLRWARADAKAGRLLSPQWWTNTGWSYMSDAKPLGRKGMKHRARISAANGNQNNGGIAKLPSGMYRQFMVPEYPGHTLAYGETATLTQMGGLSSFYTLPEWGTSTVVAYAGIPHPEQTWSGKSGDDILLTYATNAAGSGSAYTDLTVYFHRVVKATGF